MNTKCAKLSSNAYKLLVIAVGVRDGSATVIGSSVRPGVRVSGARWRCEMCTAEFVTKNILLQMQNYAFQGVYVCVCVCDGKLACIWARLLLCYHAFIMIILFPLHAHVFSMVL